MAQPKEDRSREVTDPAEKGTASHPLGTVAAAAGGAAAGAISGIAAGPVGSLAGAVGGAALGVAGTAAGRQPTKSDPDETPPPISEEQRREAMEYGAQAHRRLGRGAAWDDAEPSLRTHWASSGRSQRTAWHLARDAVRAGWENEA